MYKVQAVRSETRYFATYEVSTSTRRGICPTGRHSGPLRQINLNGLTVHGKEIDLESPKHHELKQELEAALGHNTPNCHCWDNEPSEVKLF